MHDHDCYGTPAPQATGNHYGQPARRVISQPSMSVGPLDGAASISPKASIFANPETVIVIKPRPPDVAVELAALCKIWAVDPDQLLKC